MQYKTARPIQFFVKGTLEVTVYVEDKYTPGVIQSAIDTETGDIMVIIHNPIESYPHNLVSFKIGDRKFSAYMDKKN